MALLKGPKLLNTELLPSKSLFSPGGDSWLLGCILLLGSSFFWSLWMVLQVMPYICLKVSILKIQRQTPSLPLPNSVQVMPRRQAPVIVHLAFNAFQNTAENDIYLARLIHLSLPNFLNRSQFQPTVLIICTHLLGCASWQHQNQQQWHSQQRKMQKPGV